MVARNTDGSRGAAADPTEATDAVDSPTVAIRNGEPTVTCPYCGRPFHERRLRTLHCGLEHPDRLSDRERAAFERAYLEEDVEIRRFRLYALGALVLVYFVMLFLYAFVT